VTVAAPKPVLRVDGLSRRFGARTVFADLDLAVMRGERVAVRGPNGVGKTTLLRCIAGTVEPSTGVITIEEHRAGSIAARRVTGVSFSQERSFYLRLTGYANLVFYARLRGYTGREARRLVHALEQELELKEILAQRIDRCSTGMVQQLALARALLDNPSLLLLDEPTRSLDDDATGRLWAALERRVGTTILIATHREDDVDHSDRSFALGT